MSASNENASNADHARRRGRRQLLLLAALFFIPLALAFWLYYGPGNWHPVGGTNQGDLIDPAVTLPLAALSTADGTTLAPDFLRGKWTMLYIGDGACDQHRRKALYVSRQSRIALNKDMQRIQRVFLATSHSATALSCARNTRTSPLRWQARTPLHRRCWPPSH